MENSKEYRDETPLLDLMHPTREMKPRPLAKSYFHSPADQDFLYKAQSLAGPVGALFATVGLYDAYMHKKYRTFVPMVAHGSLFLMPAFMTGSIYIATNAIAVKINGKDTPWCHFWGSFLSVAYLSHRFKLGIIHPLAILAGFFSVRYRYNRGREIELGKPMTIPREFGAFPKRMVPSMFSHICRTEPIFSMPSETPEL